ncbi:hypothetical protein M1843_04150 [Isoptericola sp. 4D.3]|uniref:Uncharacterized protein n=1 Tax=Isoptericola peretonis TaxID=2918523 RepID=A0ABT0J0B5_9MICO|nr:hypothetical protein [Isoptericola sp. 4D.3]
MSTNHARDGWADARTDEALRRELGALVGLGARSSGLDGALGAVRRRVRRRRTVKQAGIGATTLAVAAGLVLGGAALLPDAPQPPPGPASTPTTTPTSRAADDPNAVSELVQTGHQPTWLAGTGLTCGMAAEDVAPADGSTYRMALVPSGSDLGGAGTGNSASTISITTRIQVDASMPGDAVLLGPSLMWSQDGRVVDLGTDGSETPVDLAPGPLERAATDSPTTTCAPDGRAEGRTAYPHRLPDGRYQVRPFGVAWSDGFTRSTVVASPSWVDVDLDADGVHVVPHDRGVFGSDDCSAAGLDVPVPDLTDVPEPARGTASTLLAAALECNDDTLTAIAEEAGRHDLNWGGRPPRALLGLPRAEQEEDVYAILARLLTGTTPCVIEAEVDGRVEHAYSWPRMGTGMCEATAEDWQDAVDAGAITAQEAEETRAGDRSDYEGWRLTVDGHGDWMQFVDGYLGPPRGE